MAVKTRPTLNWGFDVIVRHAVSTSTFLSLFCVFGKLDPLHITNGVLPSSPVDFLRKGAKGISHAGLSTFILSLLLAAGESALALDPGLEAKPGLCTKFDWPLSVICFDSCAFVFGHSFDSGLLADGLAELATPAGEDEDDDNEGVRCETGESELGGVAIRAWKSTVLGPLDDRKLPPKS